MMNPTALLSPIFSVAKAFELRIRLGYRVPRESLTRLLEQLTPRFLPPITMNATRIWYVIRFEEAVCRRSRVLPDTCLYRALTRYALLRRAGYAAKFVMGMDPHAREDLTAHAWVELDGAPFHETLDARFVVTYVYPDDPPATTAKRSPP